MRKKNHFKEFIELLSSIHHSFPKDGIGRHFSIAFADYPDLWAVTDRELVFALQKYQTELELDNNQLVDDDYISRIEEDAKHLFDIAEEQEEE